MTYLKYELIEKSKKNNNFYIKWKLLPYWLDEPPNFQFLFKFT